MSLAERPSLLRCEAKPFGLKRNTPWSFSDCGAGTDGCAFWARRSCRSRMSARLLSAAISLRYVATAFFSVSVSSNLFAGEANNLNLEKRSDIRHMQQ